LRANLFTNQIASYISIISNPLHFDSPFLSIFFLSKYMSQSSFFYIDNNYTLPSGQMPMTNANMPYMQQQPTPVVNEEKHEPQLITFD